MAVLKFIFKNILIFLLLFLNENSIKCDDTPNVCPEYCRCDLFEEHNRADCRARRLISPSIEIPPVVEYLDLSYNEITFLDNECFKHLIYLYKLNLAHNAIHTIELDVFAPLEYLNILDLSYNRLEYLDPRLIETNSQLQTLNLEGNKFMSLPTAPLLRSSSLLHLNLRNAQINFINYELFDALPQLQQLDVAQNLIINFQAGAFNAAHQLRQINFEENPLICDQALRLAIATLERRHIIVTLDDCQPNAPQRDSDNANERIELLESQEASDGSVIAEPIDIEQIWHKPRQHNANNDDDAQQQKQQQLSVISKFTLATSATCNGTANELCRRYQQCLSNISRLLAANIELKTDAANNKDTFTLNDLKLAIIMGAAAGASLVIIMGTCVIWCQTFCGKRKGTAMRQRGSLGADILLPAQAIPTPIVQTAEGAQTAAPARQPRRNYRRGRAPQPPQQRQIVAVRDTGNNFISRLFGRPARHQYYRTINENAATLIRSLSRSNLFTYRDRDREREQPSPSAPNSPDILDGAHANGRAQFYVERASSQREPRPTQRPETPPPLYGDIVLQCERK